MLIYTIIAYSALIMSIVSFIIALKGRTIFYWVSALSIYLFSFLSGFSIGQITVGLTFIPITLGVAVSLGWIRQNFHHALFTGLGVAIGVIMVAFWGNKLFYPIFIWFN
ncbi:MAG TPA: hypothetical protein VK085_06440 [Pseudogracilibacillus sp.]|nr:hypothetical protein [Pseudogracilibacillus sp.]